MNVWEAMQQELVNATMQQELKVEVFYFSYTSTIFQKFLKLVYHF